MQLGSQQNKGCKGCRDEKERPSLERASCGDGFGKEVVHMALI